MAGSLDYSLGLATTNFLGGINLARGALAGFIGFATGAGGLVAGVLSQIEKGAGLKDLSARTGESVRDLYSLQNAFAIVGVQAGNISPLLFTIQKALGGISDAGEPTDAAFKRIGLNIDDLKKLDAPALLSTLATSLGKVDRATASNVASKIAGRGGAADLLQIARDSEDFAAAIERSAAGAALFQRNANAFDAIDDTFTSIRQNSSGLFAGIAAGVAPALQGVLNQINSSDFLGIGIQIGNALSIIPEAFKQQQLGELVRLSLIIGFGEALNFFSAGLQRIFAAIPGLVGSAILAANSASLNVASSITSKSGGAAVSALLPPGLAQIASVIEGKTGGISAAFAKAADALNEAASDMAADAIGAGKKLETVDVFNTQRERAALGGLFNNLFIPPGEELLKGKSIGDGSVSNLLANASRGSGSDADALTRIGGFSGSGAGLDAPQKTAQNTGKLVQQMKDLISAVTKLVPAGSPVHL